MAQTVKTIKNSILVKIAGLSSLFVFLAILILTFINSYQMNDISLKTAITVVQSKIQGDLNTFEYMISKEYGDLHMENGTLVDREGNPINERYDLIDRISKDLNIVATIFVRDGTDYRRIITNIIDSTGKRAVGTMLGSDSWAYWPISNGMEYIGDSMILGKQFIW
ncbi:hypothetical protein FACS1894164_12760 [Spirochaetia bacterium]|nr:hypothetical protein FACS1894164_12760 [Spirochaetia bacterium]